ncbi:MAG: AAA family ATPase [Bacilli bacterium]|nr:AAA family ATPase [Bacilli bacterium]
MNEIKELRLAKKLTQQECAEILGVSKRTVQNLEDESSNRDTDKFQYYVRLLKEAERSEFLTNVVLGKDLLKLHDIVKNYRKRDCFPLLCDYLHNDYRGKVFILYGLRRSGKTTLIFQALGEVDVARAAYIKVKEGDSMADLLKDINRLKNRGVEYLFIDEATLIEDFINTAATLSDVYSALGLKIVLSGTDSLGFAFAANQELYDRNVMVHTSYISFREFSYVLGIDDIDRYIEFGGTLKPENMGFDDPDYKNEDVSFRNEESTRKYIDTAICRNIQRSLKNFDFGSRFGHLKQLYDQGELTNAINRIIEDMNHDFLVGVVTRRFKSHDLGSSRQLLAHSGEDEVQTALYDIDGEKLLARLKAILDIKEKTEQTVEVTQEAVGQIKEYLRTLDLIKDVKVIYGDGSSSSRTVFTQPGMRYAITKALVHSLLQDPLFQSLSEKGKKEIVDTMLNDVKGRMLEDIVLLDASLSSRSKMVFKYIDFTLGEFDLAIYDPEQNQVDIGEIKHSLAMVPETQAKFLYKADLIASLERRFGQVERRFVLYRGKDGECQGVIYRNVEAFLKTGQLE